MPGKYLTFQKSSLLKGLPGGLVVQDAAKGDWDNCPEAGRWKKTCNSKWDRVALLINQWFESVVMNGCTKKQYDELRKKLESEYGHNAAEEFVYIFPSDKVAGDKGVSNIQKILFKAGNSKEPGFGDFI